VVLYMTLHTDADQVGLSRARSAARHSPPIWRTRLRAHAADAVATAPRRPSPQCARVQAR
jgi:hypothetical protein